MHGLLAPQCCSSTSWTHWHPPVEPVQTQVQCLGCYTYIQHAQLYQVIRWQPSQHLLLVPCRAVWQSGKSVMDGTLARLVRTVAAKLLGCTAGGVMDRVVAQLLAEIDGAQVILAGVNGSRRLRAPAPDILRVSRTLKRL